MTSHEPWITHEELQALVSNGVRESTQLEFKRDQYTWDKNGTREFLADVTAMANTRGGDILIGLEEEEGAAKDLVGVEIADPDKEVQRMASKLRSCLDPALTSVDIAPVRVSEGRYVLCLRIPLSWGRPHRLHLGKDQFFARNTSGKHPMDSVAIRSAFLGSASAVMRVREFRRSRLARLQAGEGPVGMAKGALVVLHAVPLSSLDPGGPEIDLKSIRADDDAAPIGFATQSGDSNRYNLDGLVRYVEFEAGVEAYTQVFRNGVLEGVNTGLLGRRSPNSGIEGNIFDPEIRAGIGRFRALTKRSGKGAPIAWMISLVGVKGECIRASGSRKGEPFVQDLVLPDPVVQESPEERYVNLCHRLLDPIWQASGWEGSPRLPGG